MSEESSEILARLERVELDIREMKRMLAETTRLAERVSDPHHRIKSRDAWVRQDG